MCSLMSGTSDTQVSGMANRTGKVSMSAAVTANPPTLACVGRLRNLVAVDQVVAVILRHE